MAATSNGAKALGVSEITGTLEKGKSADLLVLLGDPLQDIQQLAVENMAVIMKEGDLIRCRLRCAQELFPLYD